MLEGGEVGNSAELAGHHLFFKKMNFLKSCHTVNYEMDLNQLVADITIKKRRVCVRVHDCVLFWFLVGLGYVQSDAVRFLVTAEEDKESGDRYC